VTKQERLDKFTSKLAEISSKYGITIKSIGGVEIYEEDELDFVEYSKDHTSGDLFPYATFK
jgi:hypothetical protein